ncbi:MAG TPA: TCP-1/cpn60 chaperonin family protein, partial [Caldilineaceae bacterium]|nr:TCP-1/cpn60 chaperonin family protein [Caldilineaceae bacterium]
GVALLEVGGATESERDYLKARAKSAVQSLRLALQDGILAGGGVAYVRALAHLQQDSYTVPLVGDEQAALPILRTALVAPAETILANAGWEPAPVIQRLLAESMFAGYDVLQRNPLVTEAAAVIDPASVAQAALRIGVSGALMAITTDTLVHRPRHNRDEEVDFRV